MGEPSGSGSPVLLTDRDLDGVTAGDAVTWMLEALRHRASGQLISPARVKAQFDDGRVVMTAGTGESLYGYRIYDTLPTSAGEQVVVAHDRASGKVVAIQVGNALGMMRTGALGGAALSLLGPVNASGGATVAVIGGGAQARAQLWAASGVLDIDDVRVVSRTSGSRDALASYARERLGLNARALDSAQEAVAGADVVILATNSPTPVIDTDWLASDVFVTTMGPKQVGRAEFPIDLVQTADLVVTDSPDQLRAYDPPTLVSAAGMADAVVDLASLADSQAPHLRSGRRVYLSVGLSGTEVHLLGRLAEQMAHRSAH